MAATVRGTLTLAAGALTLAALAAAAGGAQAMQKGGGISTRSATPGAVTFDPPLVFAATLPLRGFYLNAKTGMSFVGTGALLDATSPSFSGVTGGFLAFDCHSRNADGSVPELPLRIKFSRPVARSRWTSVPWPAPAPGDPDRPRRQGPPVRQAERRRRPRRPDDRGRRQHAADRLRDADRPLHLAVDDIFGSNAKSMVLGHR